MTIEELLAREGIRKTIAHYTDAGDNSRYEDLVRCYAEDGVFEIAIGTWQGRPAIEQALRDLRARRDGDAPLLQRHHLGTCLIDVEDETHARAITYFAVVSNGGLDHAGRYLDKLVKRDGRWQFAHRNVVVEWRSEASGFVAGKDDADAFEAASLQAVGLS
jgi:ketosteroid isomerase-like protein